jgi:hypothetical protein
MIQFLTRLFSRQESTAVRVEVALDRIAVAAETMAADWEMAQSQMSLRLGIQNDTPDENLLDAPVDRPTKKRSK